MARYLSPWGELDEPDLTERLSPHGPLPPDPAERAAAEAAWNAPPGFGVRRGGEATPQTQPIPNDIAVALAEIAAAINRELTACGQLGIAPAALWRLLRGESWPNATLQDAIAAALARPQLGHIDEALRQRLGRLAAR